MVVHIGYFTFLSLCVHICNLWKDCKELEEQLFISKNGEIMTVFLLNKRILRIVIKQ